MRRVFSVPGRSRPTKEIALSRHERRRTSEAKRKRRNRDASWLDTSRGCLTGSPTHTISWRHVELSGAGSRASRTPARVSVEQTRLEIVHETVYGHTAWPISHHKQMSCTSSAAFGADSANFGLTALLPMESMNTRVRPFPIPCVRSGFYETTWASTDRYRRPTHRLLNDTRFIAAHRPFVSWLASSGFVRFGHRHGMVVSTMSSRARVLWPGTVLRSSSRRASRLMSLSFAGR